MKDKDDGTFMTGAGLHLEEIEYDELEANGHFDEDNSIDDFMEEIKRDVFRMKNVKNCFLTFFIFLGRL